MQTLYALMQAIKEFKEEGIENRYLRYSENWHLLKEGLDKLGLSMLLPPEIQSKLMITIIEPEGFDYEHFHDFFFERNITVYPGKLPGKNTFRIGTIGDLYPEDIVKFIALLEEYLLD